MPSKYSQAGYYMGLQTDAKPYLEMAQRERLAKAAMNQRRREKMDEEAFSTLDWKKKHGDVLPIYQQKIAGVYTEMMNEYYKESQRDPEMALKNLRMKEQEKMPELLTWKAKSDKAKQYFVQNPGDYVNADIQKWASIFYDPNKPVEAVSELNDPKRGWFASPDGTFAVDLVKSQDLSGDVLAQYDKADMWNERAGTDKGDIVPVPGVKGKYTQTIYADMNPDAYKIAAGTILGDPKKLKAFMYSQPDLQYPDDYWTNPKSATAFQEQVVQEYTKSLMKPSYKKDARPVADQAVNNINVNTNEGGKYFTTFGPQELSYTTLEGTGKKVKDPTTNQMVYEKIPYVGKLTTGGMISFGTPTTFQATGQTVYDAIGGETRTLTNVRDVQVQSIYSIPTLKNGRPIGDAELSATKAFIAADIDGKIPRTKEQKDLYAKKWSEMLNGTPEERAKIIKETRSKMRVGLYASVQWKTLQQGGATEFDGWMKYNDVVSGPVEQKVRGDKNGEVLYKQLKADKKKIVRDAIVGIGLPEPIPIPTKGNSIDYAAAREDAVYMNSYGVVYIWDGKKFNEW